MASVLIPAFLRTPSFSPSVIERPITIHLLIDTIKVMKRPAYIIGEGVAEVRVLNSGVGYKARVRIAESATGVLIEERVTDDNGVAIFSSFRKDIAYDFEAVDIAGVKNSIIRSGIYLT